MNYFKRLFQFKRAGMQDWLGRWEKHNDWGQLNRHSAAKNSIWFLGGSDVLGIGVKSNEVSSFLLEQQTGIRVFNAGINGASPITVKDELFKMLDKGLTPKGIIIAWPYATRWQHYTKLGTRVLWTPMHLDSNLVHHNNHYGCKKLYPKEYKEYLRLLKDNSIIELNKNAITETRNRIKDIPNIEFTFINEGVLDVKQLTPEIDRASEHPGPLTHKKVADILTDIVKDW